MKMRMRIKNKWQKSFNFGVIKLAYLIELHDGNVIDDNKPSKKKKKSYS